MHNIINRFRETGEISVHKGQDRRSLLDAHDLRALRRHCITHCHDSVIDITKWAQEYLQKPLLVNTIHHAICRCQLKLYDAKRKPFVNMVQKRRRALWAKAHLKWTVSKWEEDLPACYQRSVQKPTTLMVWGCISAYGMGSLHVLEGTMNAERYIKVLEQHMLPSRQRLFQQDKAKPRTAAITTAWLHSRRVQVLNWLPAVQIFHRWRTFGASLNEKYIKHDHKLFSSWKLISGKNGTKFQHQNSRN